MNFKEYLKDHADAFDGISQESLNDFITGLEAIRESRGTLWVAGNGGSAATASHAVADFAKTSTQGGKGAIKTIAISEMVSLQTAIANDISFTDGISKTLELVASEGDALLVVSVSGLSPNLVEGFNFARKSGLKTFSLVGQRGSEIATRSNHAILVPSDDYQVVENIHMMLIHWFVKELS